ncbi:MAG TPA: hypothetical protein VF978_02925 [Gemmatimonadales bacterium]
MFPSRVVPLALVLTAWGCVRADILRLDAAPRPQTQPAVVRVLGDEPRQPYEVLAIITVRSGYVGLEGLRERLVKEAALLGGDAVLLGTGSLSRVGTGGEYGGTVLQLSGKAIVFKRESPAAESPR